MRFSTIVPAESRPRTTATIVVAAVMAVLAVALAPAAQANHATGTLSSPIGNPATGVTLQDGNWSFIANYPSGPAVEQPIGVDVERFARQRKDGIHRYLIASSMTIGLSIFDVTRPGSPVRVADYGSAACGPEANVQDLIDVLMGGHDFDPGGSALGAVHGWEDDVQVTPNGKVAVIATDAPGRCHDPAGGGMEIVDISNPSQPSLLGLVRLKGESHNTTIDRDRPWIVYDSNSDTGTNNFIDVVDMKSCLALRPSKCRPSVARLQFRKDWTTGTMTKDPSACHDLDYRRGKLYGACINSSMIFDVSNVWRNGHLTGTDLTDASQVGKANACSLADPSPEAMVALKVVDCRNWTRHAWRKSNARPVRMPVLTMIRHAGADLSEDEPPGKDIQISHQAMPLAGGRIMIVSDERGGGLNASPGECPGGGIWFYDVRDRSHPRVARTPASKKAIFLPTPNDFVQTEGNNCTAHVFHPWPREGRLMTDAWYSSGTQVFRYRIDLSRHPARVSFFARKAYVPSGASTWTSRVYAQRGDGPGPRTLYFFATDISRGFDFFKLRLG